MTYEQFLKASNDLKAFINEQNKLYSVLEVISPSGTGVCEFGNEFIDAYISAVEIALNDESNSFSWFVFENRFGSKGLKCRRGGKDFIINNERDMYLFIKKDDYFELRDLLKEDMTLDQLIRNVLYEHEKINDYTDLTETIRAAIDIFNEKKQK